MPKLKYAKAKGAEILSSTELLNFQMALLTLKSYLIIGDGK